MTEHKNVIDGNGVRGGMEEKERGGGEMLTYHKLQGEPFSASPFHRLYPFLPVLSHRESIHPVL